MQRVLVTGANGHLGRRLLAEAPWPTRAVVRSAQAAAALGGHADVRIADFADHAGLVAACAGCTAIAHLVGILREGGGATYRAAHEDATRALLAAAEAADARRIVYLSILGADAAAPNRCLASKAAAEALLAEAPLASLVLRVPMVLGEGDRASAALLVQARRTVAATFRAASLEQPIYAGDVIAAVIAALRPDAPCGVLELAGPRSLPRRDLIAALRRPGAGAAYTASIPIAAGRALAWLLEKTHANAPLTRDMLGVLDHDDAIDPQNAARALGIRLTDFSEMVRRIAAAGD